MTKQTWQDIYTAGEQLNRYPYDFIVSSFFRYRPRKSDGEKLKVLDLGCGAGNHTLFCAENGAEVLALDYSTSALDVVVQRADQRGLTSNIRCMQSDFEAFTLDEGGFDLVIDRLAVSHVSGRHARTIYDCVFELMNPQAILLSNLFTADHSHKDFGRYNEADDIWQDFSEGIFEHLNTAYFYDEDSVRQLLQRYRLLSLVRETSTDLVNQEQQEIWKIVAQRD